MKHFISWFTVMRHSQGVMLGILFFAWSNALGIKWLLADKSTDSLLYMHSSAVWVNSRPLEATGPYTQGTRWSSSTCCCQCCCSHQGITLVAHWAICICLFFMCMFLQIFESEVISGSPFWRFLNIWHVWYRILVQGINDIINMILYDTSFHVRRSFKYVKYAHYWSVGIG